MSGDTTTSGAGGLPRFTRQPGDTAFAAFLLLFSLFLFWQMWSQTVWQASGSFAAQPGFWPRLAISGMVICAALNLQQSLRRRFGRASTAAEIGTWFRSVEYALWFMAYVFLTPLVGYLPASVLFAVSLAWRSGYRGWRALGWAAIGAVAVVVLFKAFLSVRIPGGALYEVLPHDLRNFMILYL